MCINYKTILLFCGHIKSLRERRPEIPGCKTICLLRFAVRCEERQVFEEFYILPLGSLALGENRELADDISAYSYKTGQQSYETRMSETPEWFDNKDEAETADYSFNTGNQNAQARKNAFAGMPAGDDLSDEELNEFFSSNGLGIGSAYENGEYNESAKASYGYNKGQAAYQERHASFAGNN